MKTRSRAVLLSLAILIALPAAADSLFYSKYVNCDYGYSVDVPHDVVAHGNDALGAPNHGFGVDLQNAQSTAHVDFYKIESSATREPSKNG